MSRDAGLSRREGLGRQLHQQAVLQDVVRGVGQPHPD
eukprot:CAMPEP_0182432348 /NCGR_PEP_ID=MMETSP1167-20130531/55648_1 /TAXON_ID=2988 /ORGANISM="Mallomonas Sp, Strain CCMP3275" /LENGTH=36 /DNA_ID= /DNA_START= /DNA_END= /DNA_ORIENTATION=